MNMTYINSTRTVIYYNTKDKRCFMYWYTQYCCCSCHIFLVGCSLPTVRYSQVATDIQIFAADSQIFSTDSQIFLADSPILASCSRHSDIRSRQSDILNRHSDTRSQQSDIRSRQSNIRSRQSDIRSRQSDIRSRHISSDIFREHLMGHIHCTYIYDRETWWATLSYTT